MRSHIATERNAPGAFALALGGWCLLVGATGVVCGEDWPCRMKDVRRGGITSEKLPLPLAAQWVHLAGKAPAPAWIESPARHDYVHDRYDLKARQNFDKCCDVAAVGDLLYFGSSASGTVTCLRAVDGREVWTFFSDGPVRMSPQVAGGRVYFGSDDGLVYCLDATDASVIWKERAGESDDLIWGNEHMISVCPVRGSVVVDGADVFWTAGIFEREGMFVCKRSAADGQPRWTKPAVRPHQGYLVLSHDLLIAPCGKAFPAVYRRSDGEYVGDLNEGGRDGGWWALITPDEKEIFTGPGIDNSIRQFRAPKRTLIASLRAANSMVADSTGVFYNTDSGIFCVKRDGRTPTWHSRLVYPYALIKAGDHLFVGGDGRVAAVDANTGKGEWTAPVKGKAYGLAVSRRRLFVSTDLGAIHCFAAPGGR